MSTILYRRETPNVAIDAKDAGEEFAKASADVQAEFLHGWEQQIDQWSRHGNGRGCEKPQSWCQQCRAIADEMSAERKAAIALMLETLLDDLKEAPGIPQLEAENAGLNRELERLRSIIAGTEKPLIVQNEDGSRWLSLDETKSQFDDYQSYLAEIGSGIRNNQ